jgi:alpha-L-rhamnosidase
MLPSTMPSLATKAMPRSFPGALLVVLLALAPISISPSQEMSPSLLDHRWKAEWISCPGAPGREFGVYHFRKTFSLASVPEHFVVHISGDNRYWLFANGARVVEGPARGDLKHWRYETVDIAKLLRPGKNVLAAVVWNFAELAPMAQMTNETGLLVQGDSSAEQTVNTGASWKVASDPAYEMIPLGRHMSRFYTVVGPGERVDGSKYPWGWEQPNYDDSRWQAASTITVGGPRGIQDSPSQWMLVPRPIPLMENTPQRLARVVRVDHMAGFATGTRTAAFDAFLQGKSPVNILAKTRMQLLFDQGALTTAYPELVVRGGRGATLTITYAEALWKGREKGNRNETEGKEILGYSDEFRPDGGVDRIFRPLYWRTFRYLQLDIATGDEPLVLDDLRAVFSAYPFTLRAEFKSDDPALEQIMAVGWRTARLCAHETYMDCPYYEQLQYAGDTRIQALVSLYMTGDDRLVKNAIESLDESRTPEGLTQSRYPSFLPQYIPPFSLLWIGMMHDLWWYHGDADFLRQFLVNERGVIDWFESRLLAGASGARPSGANDTGPTAESRSDSQSERRSALLGRLEWWDFADWNDGFPDGVPPQEADGESAVLSLQFAMILRDAADLESAFGSTERAVHYPALSRQIADAVYKTCWDPTRGLIADTPARRHFSQHASILGVLADSIPAADQQVVMRKVLSDTSLTQCSYYFRFYLFRAMKKAGLGDEYLDQLGPWLNMLKLGLSTWAETPEPTRSDCHAWSAHPNFDMLATVAGIESGAPGFAEVAIEPHLGPLKHLEATLPHPQGEIRVHYERQGADGLVADVTLPGTLTGWFTWNGKKVQLHPGDQHLVYQP